MKLFSEKVTPTFTSSNQNILTIKEFNEIFFDVYELEINGNKYIAEKISEYKGNPVVNIPVVIDGKEFEAPFVLQTGKLDIIFNERNSTFIGSAKPETVEVYDEVKSREEEVEEIIFEKRESILEEIQQARQLASQFAEDIKQEKIRAADARLSKDKAVIINTANKFKSELVDEFLAITENTRSELYTYTQDENKKSHDFIVDTVTQLAEKLTQDLNDEVEIQTTKAISVFEEKIDKLARNILTEKLLKTISLKSAESDKKIDLKFETVSKTIAKVLGDYEVQLNDDVKLKLENFDSQILTLEKNSVDLNNTITKNTNKALSRIGNVKTQLEEAVVNVSVTLSDELTSKITLAESKIKNYYDERITLVESSITDITAQERAHILNVIQESKQSILDEVSKIKTSVPSVIVEKTREPKGEADIQKIKTDLEKTISNRFTQELANVRRIIELSSGGGSVAVQFADGGTMNGNLTVVGTISASQYLGIPVYTDTDTLSTVTGRGNTTTDSITVGGVTVLGGLSADRIYTTQLDALSANITVIDIKQYELSGFNVQGDCTVQGSVSANKFVTIGGLSSQFVKGDGSLDDNIYLTSEDLNSNIILYPTTTESDVEGYGLMVSSITDVAYDDPAVNVPTGPIDSADTYISSIISREGLIVGDLDTINMTVIGRIRKTSGGNNKNATFHFHVYKRDNFGNETEIGLSGDTLTVEASLYEEYRASVLLPASTWEPTDQLVLKLYGILIGSGGGSSPTYDFEFGGETPVRVLIPLPTSVQLSNYVPYIGASKDLYLGVHTVNTAAVYTNDIVNDGAALTIKTNNGQPLNFETNNVQRMSVTSAGNVGIGTTAPNERLTVVGNISATGSVTANNLVYTSGDQTIAGVKTFSDNIVGNGTSNRLPNQTIDTGDSIMTQQLEERSFPNNLWIPWFYNMTGRTGNRGFATALMYSFIGFVGGVSLTNDIGFVQAPDTPWYPSGSGQAQRFARPFSILFEADSNNQSTADKYFVVGKQASTNYLALPQIGDDCLSIRWINNSQVEITIFYNGVSDTSGPINLPAVNLATKEKYLVVWDATTLYLYGAFWFGYNEMPKLSLIGSVSASGVLPTAMSSFYIYHAQHLTGASSNSSVNIYSLFMNRKAIHPI